MTRAAASASKIECPRCHSRSLERYRTVRVQHQGPVVLPFVFRRRIYECRDPKCRTGFVADEVLTSVTNKRGDGFLQVDISDNVPFLGEEDR